VGDRVQNVVVPDRTGDHTQHQKAVRARSTGIFANHHRSNVVPLFEGQLSSKLSSERPSTVLTEPRKRRNA
jgi:hypothetical protein